MGSEKKHIALAEMLELANKQGYVTFDNIMDCADNYDLPMRDFDWLSNAITVKGIIVYDEEPQSIHSEELDDYGDYSQIDYEYVYNRIIELDDSLFDFVDSIRQIKPPQRKEIDTLKYQLIEGNLHARKRMIEMHLRFALRIALQRAESYDTDICDVISDACLGLINAVDKYNPDINGPFGSYASMWILQNISRSQPTQRPLIYYPVHRRDVYFPVYLYLKERGYLPAQYEINLYRKYEKIIKDNFEIDDEQVTLLLNGMFPLDSYDEMFSDYEKEDDYYEVICEKTIYPEELIFDAEIELKVIQIMLKEQIAELLKTLSEREQKVLIMRYGLDGSSAKTLEEVGSIFNVTRERIRQIENKALTKLKHPSRSKKVRDYVTFSEKKNDFEDDENK